MDTDQLPLLADWLADREAIHDLARAWPPGSKVTSHEDAPLLIPAPGIVGKVYSYFEDGLIGVLAPMATTLTSPLTGNTAREGELMKAQCAPHKLVLLEYGPVTPEDIRDALALLSA